jgi:ABC-type glycerol-3-phosphate transport system substrate-binding protein
MTRAARAVAVLLVIAGLGLAGCGGGGGSQASTPTLTWYINPDNGGQADLAKACTKAADGKYRIDTSLLPNDATSQREQLVRRLAAKDSSVDLMSLDVSFVAEFAQAEFLRAFSEDEAAGLTEGVLDAPKQTVEWHGKTVAAPFWANTQLLWYRKSVAQRAGLDLTQPVTWEQVIEAARKTHTTVEVQASLYEGYMVWINALVVSGGGEVLKDPGAGRAAQPELASAAGRDAARIIHKVATSGVADPQINTSIEETARAGFQANNGGFMVNWPYIYAAAKTAVQQGSLDQSVVDDIGWARYPQTDAATQSAPPLGGIDLGIGAFSKHKDLAVDAVQCITTVENQTAYMLAEGNPGARGAVFDDPAIRKAFPMADLIRDSIDTAGPRPQSAYYTDVSAATVRDFHPPSSVKPDSTPRKADDLIRKVLEDKALV